MEAKVKKKIYLLRLLKTINCGQQLLAKNWLLIGGWWMPREIEAMKGVA